MPTLRCKFAAKGAEEGLRGTVAFGTLEKKKQASATNTVRGSHPETTPWPQRHILAPKIALATWPVCGHVWAAVFGQAGQNA